MTNSDELTTMQIMPETAREDFAPNADRPEHSGYDVPAPEGAVMAGDDLDDDKIREAEEAAADVAEICGF